MKANSLKKEAGYALISALIIVTILSLVMVNLVYSTSLAMAKTEAVINQSRGVSIVFGFEEWVRSGLNKDSEHTSVDHLGEVWAESIEQVPFGGGLVSGAIEDLGAKLNINNVLISQKQNEKEIWLRLIVNYLSTRTKQLNLNISFDEYHSNMAFLLNQGLPLYVMAQELKTLPVFEGMSSKDFKLLTVGLYASPELSPVNINTASTDVIQSLFKSAKEDWVSEWVDQARLNPALRSQDFFDFFARKDSLLFSSSNKLPFHFVSVTSNFMKLKSIVEFDGTRKVFNTIFNKSTSTKIVQRWMNDGKQ